MRSFAFTLIASLLLPLISLRAQEGGCDFNGNGFPDISDLIRAAGLVGGVFSPDTFPDYWPDGDCDTDSVHLTLSDLFGLHLRIIYGSGRGDGELIESQSDTMLVLDRVTYPGESFELPIVIRSGRLLCGAQLYALYDSTLLTITGISVPDSQPGNMLNEPRFINDGISAWTGVDPGYEVIILDPLLLLSISVSPTAPVPSFTRIDFADNPHYAVYTGLSQVDTTVPPPEPEVAFIRPVKIGADILILETAVEERPIPRLKPYLFVWSTPSNIAFQIRFYLPASGVISLDIFDLLGRRVANLADGIYSSGAHDLTWNASGLSSGLYFCSLAVDDSRISKKITLMK